MPNRIDKRVDDFFKDRDAELDTKIAELNERKTTIEVELTSINQLIVDYNDDKVKFKAKSYCKRLDVFLDKESRCPDIPSGNENEILPSVNP